MERQFGQRVYERALTLQEQGKDANQIAKILCDQDPDGHNYGIGIVLDGNGRPMGTSSTLLDYTAAELELSQRGTYMNSNAILDKLKIATLQWQRIPEHYWEQCVLALPSDAGTGAVKTGVELFLALYPQLQNLGVQELGWPAYKAMARLSRIRCEEFPADGVIADEYTLPIYQAGPMNTTGVVIEPEIIDSRAQIAAETNTPVLLDRAYPGFEYARLLRTHSYNDVMRMSYEHQIAPFLDRGVTFCLAISPTKAFVSFALRPCGLLLLFCPDASQRQEISGLLNMTIRARGSAFEHLVSRAFAKAMTDRARLEDEHLRTLARVADAEAMWQKLVQGTPIEALYSDSYAGLFRNPMARADAQIAVYNQHIYPVFANQRCRQNVTGIPFDEELARTHVQVFAEQCY